MKEPVLNLSTDSGQAQNAPSPLAGEGVPERGAGAGATRSRGPTCGDATVEPAKARPLPALARLRGHIPKGTLFRPPTRPWGMRPWRHAQARANPPRRIPPRARIPT